MQYHVTGASVLFPFRPLTRVFRACRDRIALVYAQIDTAVGHVRAPPIQHKGRSVGRTCELSLLSISMSHVGTPVATAVSTSNPHSHIEFLELIGSGSFG